MRGGGADPLAYRAFVTDIDGTLLGINGGIAPRDVAAIRELERRGIPVTLCTGRMYSGTRAIAMELGLCEPVACIDGSHIVDSGTHRELATAPLPPEALATLCRLLERTGPTVFAFAGDRLYYDANGQPYLPYLATWSEDTVEVETVLDPDRFGYEEKVAALVALGTEDQIASAHEALREHHGTLLQAACFALQRPEDGGLWGMIARAARVDKGTALEWLAAHYGITLDEIVAVGDWVNDIPMLERAGCSFAMGQAPDSVKAAADHVLSADAWTGGGIAEAAERAGLL
ncbi:MAG: HAD family hydrolase [Pseudomonadota bacterium]|nr:MAG: HAD family phosphatase [Pseudomonadota bacterium]